MTTSTSIYDKLPDLAGQLAQDPHGILTDDQVASQLESINFLRTGKRSKDESGTIVDNANHTIVVRVLGQMYDDIDPIGTLKYVKPDEMNVSKIVNAKVRFPVGFPGQGSLDSELVAQLLNQPEFFSSVQLKIDEMLSNKKENDQVNDFVKPQNNLEFVVFGNVSPMFKKSSTSSSNTSASIAAAKESAKIGLSANSIPFLRHADALDTLPDAERIFAKVSPEVRRQFTLNTDNNVFDADNAKVHPSKYSSVFKRDVWVIMDVYMKYIDMTEQYEAPGDQLYRKPFKRTRTFQLVVTRLQALNHTTHKDVLSYVNRPNLKRSLPADNDNNGGPLPPIVKPFAFSSANPLGSNIMPMELDIAGPSLPKRAKPDPLPSVSDMTLADDELSTPSTGLSHSESINNEEHILSDDDIESPEDVDDESAEDGELV